MEGFQGIYTIIILEVMMITTNGSDTMHLSKYNQKAVEQIYKTGRNLVKKGTAVVTDKELAFIATAGHAADLFNASKSVSGVSKTPRLDYTIETQSSIGNAVVALMMGYLKSGLSDIEAREKIAVKVSSYLVFELWNFLQAAAKEFSTEFDFSMVYNYRTGTKTVTEQKIILIRNTDHQSYKSINLYPVGAEFATNYVHIFGAKDTMVGVDMEFLFNKIGGELAKLLQ